MNDSLLNVRTISFVDFQIDWFFLLVKSYFMPRKLYLLYVYIYIFYAVDS